MPGFNKNVTAVTKKLQGGRANILQAICGIWQMESKGNIETSLALVIKSYPQKITKQSIESAGFIEKCGGP